MDTGRRHQGHPVTALGVAVAVSSSRKRTLVERRRGRGELAEGTKSWSQPQFLRANIQCIGQALIHKNGYRLCSTLR